MMYFVVASVKKNLDIEIWDAKSIKRKKYLIRSYNLSKIELIFLITLNSTN